MSQVLKRLRTKFQRLPHFFKVKLSDGDNSFFALSDPLKEITIAMAKIEGASVFGRSQVVNTSTRAKKAITHVFGKLHPKFSHNVRRQPSMYKHRKNQTAGSKPEVPVLISRGQQQVGTRCRLLNLNVLETGHADKLNINSDN
jgi:hypothetical protein